MSQKVEVYVNGRKATKLFNKSSHEVQEEMCEYLANEFLKVSEPYIPFDQGFLSESGTYNAKDHCVEWDTPYAHYLYEGKKYVDPKTGKAAMYSLDYGFWSRPGVTKVPTDEDLNYQGAPLRGSHWAERALQNGGLEKIEKGMLKEFTNHWWERFFL